MFDYRLHLMANKSLGAHRIGLHLSGSNTNNRVVYSGTSPAKNSFSSPALSARFSYGLNISRFNLSFDVAPGWERSKVNNTVNSFFTLVSHLQASFTPDSRNQFSLWAQAAKSGNSPADNSEAVIRLNDLMYVSGNPHLKAPLHFDMNLSYSWIPSDMFTMTAYGSLATVGDRITADFRRHDDGAALLRTLVNSGRFTSWEIGVSLRLTLLGRRLRLSATPVQRFYRSTGLNAMTYSPFAVKANAYWYQGPFWAGLHYQNGDRAIDPRNGFRTKGRDYYQISAGWGNGNWNVYAGASNIFSRGWKESVSELSGELYTCRRTTYGVSRHASVFVGATYTFGYGKKIDRRAVRRLRPIGPGRDPAKLNPDTGEIHWYDEKIRYLDNDTTPKRCRKCKMLPDCTGPCRRHVAEGEGDECFLDDLKMSIEDYALMQFRIELVKCA